MNTYKDYQFSSRQRDAQREHRRSRGVKGIDLMRAKALALKPTSKHSKGHMPAGRVAGRPLHTVAVDENMFALHASEIVTDRPGGRTYPASREAHSWVSQGRRGRARRLFASSELTYAQAMRQVSK